MDEEVRSAMERLEESMRRESDMRYEVTDGRINRLEAGQKQIFAFLTALAASLLVTFLKASGNG